LAWLLYRYAHAGGRIVSVSPPSNPRPSYAWIQSTIANVHRREIKERVKFRALCKHPI
jgi:hypothetical protein